MPPNLRLSLTIFTIGFLAEGAGELYAWLSHSTVLPGGGFLLILGPAATVVGLLALFVGRHEWNELHRTRVLHAHRAFGLVIASFVLAVLPLAIVARAGWAIPGWLPYEFGAAVGAMLLFSFVTYLLVAFHLAHAGGKAALLLALLWAIGVAALVAKSVADATPTYVADVQTGSVNPAELAAPVSALLSFFFASYFLLALGYLEAHRVVAAGPPPGSTPA